MSEPRQRCNICRRPLAVGLRVYCQPCRTMRRRLLGLHDGDRPVVDAPIRARKMPILIERAREGIPLFT